MGELHDADIAVLSPAHSFPMGAASSSRRRRKVVEWAKRTGGWIIEDDYDGEFRYDGRPIGALQTMAPNRTIYVGTTSKSLAPGLRLGWLVIPPDLLSDVLTTKTVAVGHSSCVDQLTLAQMMRSGAYDRHGRRTRNEYRTRRNRPLTMLSRFEDVEVIGTAAGLQVIVTLPDGLTETEVFRAAALRDLTIQGLSAFAADG